MKKEAVSKSPVRIAVIGCGVVADYGHIPAIARQEEAELVAFCDPDPERLRRQCERYGKPGFASAGELFGAVELDAVTLATQPDVRLDLVREAVGRGLHVFSEKPLSDTLEQARAIIELVEAHRCFLGMAFIYRGKPVIQRMKALLDEAAIGPPRSIMIDNLWDYHGLRGEAVAARRRRALRNLGTLDCGVHDLDLLRYLSGGEFDLIQAVGTCVEPENPYPDHLSVQGRMDNGVLFALEESGVWGHTAKERPAYFQSYRLLGEKGLMAAQVEFSHHRPVELQVVSDGIEWFEEVGSEKAWDDTYRQFFEVILGRRGGDAFIADGRDALANMRAASEIIAQCQAREASSSPA